MILPFKQAGNLWQPDSWYISQGKETMDLAKFPFGQDHSIGLFEGCTRAARQSSTGQICLSKHHK